MAPRAVAGAAHAGFSIGSDLRTASRAGGTDYSTGSGSTMPVAYFPEVPPDITLAYKAW